MPRPKGYGKSVRMSRMLGESRLDEEPPSKRSKSAKSSAKPKPQPAKPPPSGGGESLRQLGNAARSNAWGGHLKHTPAGRLTLTCAKCEARGAFHVAYTHPDRPWAVLCPSCFIGGKSLTGA